MKLTRAQRAALDEANLNGGDIPAASVRSRGGGSRRRMLERLREAALVEGPPWKITGIGEDVLAELRGDEVQRGRH
jgi:hypothetical protein